MKKYIFNVFLIFALSALSVSCREDRYVLDLDMEGETDVEATVVFSPITGTMDDTRTAGNAIKKIESLCILLYNADNELVRHEMVPEGSIDQTANTGTPSDAIQDGHQAESTTPRATFSIKNLKSGRYQVYAVANMGDIAAEGSGYDVSTPEKLKNTELIWNGDNVAANNQMFGYFTYENNKRSNGFDAPVLTINRANNRLHAWVKRAASKVTVAVDGSGLYPSVEVQIKSIQIKDIPRNCFLGKDNKAARANLIENGESLNVNDGEWSTVSQAKPYYYYGMKEGTKPADAQQAAHSETAEALYFYENMQGKGQSKHQVWDNTTPGQTQFPDGNNPNSEGYKDSKINGTYVEVIGYYKNAAGEGPIIYRFMLGKDVDTDYNAQRNYHYKLTLKLKNNANDNDWHIVYDPEPEIIVQSPYYISYTYDETMNLPVKIMGAKLEYLQAEIIDNGWHAIISDGEKPNPFPYYTGTLEYLDAPESYPVLHPSTPNVGVWDGFLSLRKTRTAIFGAVEDGFGSNDEKTYTENKDYWYRNNRGWRTYDIKENVKDETDGSYSITTNGAGEWNASVPLYTRARVMVAQTGYTGNNPYVSYRRKAIVRVTADVTDLKGDKRTVTQDVEIIQMRRVVNPKGIWRDKDKMDPFDVTIMILPREDASDFKPLISDGPWLAVAERGGDWYELEPIEGFSQKNPDGTISGTTDPYGENNQISFRYRPKGTTSTPRGGWIKIYYNNYSCIHKIFVRQGYDPVSFYGSNVKWHTCNLNTLSEEVSDPVLEGSYFRRKGNAFGSPIAASNNTEDWFDKNGMDRTFNIVPNGTSDWNSTTATTGQINGKTNGKAWRLPTQADYKEFMNQPNTIYAYGVLYTDGSTTTVTKVSDVYGARSGSSTEGKGMRGVFVCDSVNGTQIFLPIGASGYGRFKQYTSKEIYNRQRPNWGGVIQYANRYEAMPVTGTVQNSPWGKVTLKYGVGYKPLFWDLWRRHGALYWTNTVHHLVDDKDAAGNNIKVSKYDIGGLDINFYTMDFAIAWYGDLGLIWNADPDPSGSDAIQIRVVHDE